MYAGKEIESIYKIIAKVESLGFSNRIQKIIIAGCWAVLWLFMLVAMTLYALCLDDAIKK